MGKTRPNSQQTFTQRPRCPQSSGARHEVPRPPHSVRRRADSPPVAGSAAAPMVNGLLGLLDWCGRLWLTPGAGAAAGGGGMANACGWSMMGSSPPPPASRSSSSSPSPCRRRARESSQRPGTTRTSRGMTVSSSLGSQRNMQQDHGPHYEIVLTAPNLATQDQLNTDIEPYLKE